MRRFATMGLGFLFSVAISSTSGAEGAKPRGAPHAAQPTPTSKQPANSTSAATPATSPADSPATAPATAADSTQPSSTAATPSASPPGGPAAGDSAHAAPSPQQGKTTGMDGATYTVRLRDIEARVDELKDQIRRSHTRLALLSDTILAGGAGGSRADIIFYNEMSSAFRLTHAVFLLDGSVQYNRQDDTGALAEQREIPVFTGAIPTGDHTLQIQLTFQGNGYGVFTYLRGYKFDVKSNQGFTAMEGRLTRISAIAIEKGGATTPLEQRPSVAWRERTQTLNIDGPAGALGPTTPKGAAAPASSTPPTPANGGGGK